MAYDYDRTVMADESEDEQEQSVPPEHPASLVRCDHMRCQGETPEAGQRVCDDCDVIMRHGTPDECRHCGVDLQS